MRYSSAKIILISIAVISLFLTFANLADIWAVPDMTWALRKDNRIILMPGYSIIQRFTPSRDNLSRFEVLFGNSENKGEKVKMQIFDDEKCTHLIREKSLDATSLDSDSPYYFTFKKISDSNNKTLCFSVTFKPENSDAKSIRMFTTNEVPSKNQLLINTFTGEEIQNQSLAIRPGYKNDNWWKNMEELNQRISQYKPWFLKHYYLFAIAFMFIGLSILSLVLLITM